MRHSLGGAFALAATAALYFAPAAAQAARFDGAWTVQVITEQGNCDRVYAYPLTIRGGQVSYAGDYRVDIRGQVRSNGRVAGEISRDQYSARVTGQLDERRGSGQWSANNGCAGRWIADRK